MRDGDDPLPDPPDESESGTSQTSAAPAEGGGELQIGVGTGQGKVVIVFNKSVRWVGLDPAAARRLAESIRQESYKVGIPPRKP